MAELRLEEIRKVRLEKVNKLRELGINPYPSKVNGNPSKISDALNSLDHVVEVAGRLMAWREHGNVIFADLRDETGQIQLWFQRNNLDEQFSSKGRPAFGWKTLKLFDVGDFLYVKGKVVKTQAGEISIDVSDYQLLTKSIRPLPSSWYGFKDIEDKYRKRYLDILMNPSVKDMFIRKAKFWDVNRKFMKDRGFLEVETPILEHVTGGGDAKPFKTHHNALNEDFYLRISTELYLKRLIGAGFQKIYTLGPNFRNEGIDDEHLQEYYQIEWYWAYANYRENMAMVKEMFRYIAKEVYGKTQFTKNGMTFDLNDEWQEIDYIEIIKTKLNIDIFKDSVEKMNEVLKDNGIVLDKGIVNRDRLVDNLWKIIRKSITGPAFLVNEPKFMSPLAKTKSDNEYITERFHVLLAGGELGNGYSELNDPLDQLQRFKEQQKARDSGDEEAQMMDTDFVEMLEYGMPPTTGYAHSERLFWFLEGVTAREGVFFPQMKRKDENFNSTVKQDFDHKLVIAIDLDLPAWQVMNTSAHAAAYLGNKMSEKFDTGKYFVTKDGVNLPRNSQYPIVTVSATKDQLKDLMKKVRESDLLYIGYVPEMMKTTDDKKLAKELSEKTESEVDYVGVGIFGPKGKVDAFTKDLPLWE